YLPRVGDAFQGLEQLPMFPGLYYMRLVVASRQFATPGVQRAFAALKETGDEAMRLLDHANRFEADMAELGFPLTNGATAPAPFDFFADYLRGSTELMLDLSEAGLVPMPLWEGGCPSRLETIADIPRGKAIYWIERADLIRAKDILGDVVCLRGNVPASMLTTGTPDQVDAFSRRLIEKVGKGGGLI